MYLGASLEQIKTKGIIKCLSIFAEKYVIVAVVNLEAKLSKRDMQLPTSHSTMPTNYRTSKDVGKERNARGVQACQELIGELRWAVDIVRVGIFLEVAILYLHLFLPGSGHLQAVYQIFRYLKQVPKRKLYFDSVSPSISKN